MVNTAVVEAAVDNMIAVDSHLVDSLVEGMAVQVEERMAPAGAHIAVHSDAHTALS